MIKTTTQSDLVKFLYNEIETNEKEKIQTDILTDAELGSFYYEMKRLKNILSSLRERPTKNSVDTVLNYSKSINLHAALN